MGRGGRCEVRKGAWTQEEDVLLRNCVQANGEGNWHQVPAKAGLNRCRKSCRLRWLNYLKPNLKRGMFEEDEVDLMIKLHNLLGNRWSMIAKRLPGRTGNDVKNYWNTHVAKKLSGGAATKSSSSSTKINNELPSNVVRVQVIRPQPRTFKGRLWHWQPTMKPTALPCNSSPAVPTPTLNPPPPPPPVVFPPENEISSWWETLLADNHNVNNDPIGASCALSQGNSNNAIGSSSSNFEDSLWTMLSEENHINQSIWEKLGIDDTEL